MNRNLLFFPFHESIIKGMDMIFLSSFLEPSSSQLDPILYHKSVFVLTSYNNMLVKSYKDERIRRKTFWVILASLSSFRWIEVPHRNHSFRFPSSSFPLFNTFNPFPLLYLLPRMRSKKVEKHLLQKRTSSFQSIHSFQHFLLPLSHISTTRSFCFEPNQI